MLLLLIAHAAAGAGVDAANSVADAIYRLGFQDRSELVATGSWVTAAELYQWADEAAKRLSYQAGLFIVYDDSIDVDAGTGAYPLPATHVFTLLAAVDGALLRITPVRDLWALDALWSATTGDPKRCSMDAGSVGTITLYPKPVADGTLGQICQEFPSALVEGASTLAVAKVLADYFTYAMLAGARGKESDSAMPEMAAHFAQRMKLYEQVIEHLWGPGQ